MLITGAFAIVDPFPLNVVAGVGSFLQILFFYTRDERIWSSIYWSVAQFSLNCVALARLGGPKGRGAAKAEGPSFDDRQLFAARALQRAGGLRLEPDELRELLLGGPALPPPTWDALAAGAVVPITRVALLCDGRVSVKRPEDGATRLVDRGALLHSDVLAQRLDAAATPVATPRKEEGAAAAAAPGDFTSAALAAASRAWASLSPSSSASSSPAKHVRRPSRSFDPALVDDPRAFATATAEGACEVLSWDLHAFALYLKARRGPRLCVNALIAKAKLASYMHMDAADGEDLV